jgi:hypothetical protein
VAGQRSGLATAVMEHANALVNLASALVISSRFADAEAAYERALEVCAWCPRAACWCFVCACMLFVCGWGVCACV